MMKPVLSFALWLLPFAGTAQTFDSIFTQLFRMDCCDWTGSDGTISVPLGNGKTIWLMGDSFLGTVQPDTSRPCNSALVNNTILLQDGTTFATYYDTANTKAYLQVSDSTLLWPGHGFVENDTIYLFYFELKKSTLARLNTKLVKLRVDDLAVLEISNLPEMNGVWFGRYVLIDENFRYIFGSRVEALASRRPYLARSPRTHHIADFAAWEHFNGSGWGADAGALATIFAVGQGSVGSYLSVWFAGGKYYLVSSDNFLGPEIRKWQADAISGPYAGRKTIFDTTPFRQYQGCGLLSYNAAIHPQFNNEQGMLISFNVIPDRNDAGCSLTYCGIACCPPCGFCLHPLLFKNADTYRPKFIRVPLAETAQAAPRLLLQGNYAPAVQRMHDSLRMKGLIPLTEPYSGLPNFTHIGGGGGEKTSAAVLAHSGPDAIVDWVFLELRDSANPVLVLATRAALLQRDGDVVDVDGISPVTFPAPADRWYYLTVRHRNHLGVQFGKPVFFQKFGVVKIDFSTTSPGDLYAYNGLNPAQRLIGGKYVLWAGNGRIDFQLKYNGSVNDRNALLSEVGVSTPNTIVPGYLPTDYNLDGVVKYNGAANDRIVLLGNVGITTPSAIVHDQTAR